MYARRNVLISGSAAVTRVAAAASIAVVVGDGLPKVTWLLVVAVFGVAMVYEVLRSRRPVPGQEFRTTWTSTVIWIVVGAGYAIRGVAGLVVAGVPADSQIILIATVGLLTFGIMFVTLTWALDASSYCHSDPAHGQVDFVPAVLSKPHLAALLPYLGATRGSVVAADHGKLGGAGATPLRERGRLVTPWNIALLCCGAAGGALGVGLAAGWTLPGGPSAAVIRLFAGQSTRDTVALIIAAGALAGLCAASAVVSARGPAERWIVVLAVGAGTTAGLWPVLEARSVLAVLPWALFAGWYTWFRSQSLLALKLGFKPLINAMRWIFDAVIAVIAGRQTAALLGRAAKPQHPVSAVEDSR